MDIALYYGVLAFNLNVTFWIGEMLMGMVGCLIVVLLAAALLVTLWQSDRRSTVQEALK